MAETVTFFNMGFRMTEPDAFRHTRGQVSPMAIGNKGDGVYLMLYTYFAASAEEMKAFSEKSKKGEASEEEVQKMSDTMGMLLTVLGIDGGRGEKELRADMGMEEGSGDCFTEIGRCKDITYFAVTSRDSDEKFMAAMAPEYAEEFRILQPALLEALKKSEFFVPKDPASDLVGRTVRFETRDIDGNPVKSEDLFAGHAVTMINIWATWCGPCKNELEELGNIHRRLAGKNAAILGICSDAAEKPDVCRALIAEKKLTYLNILPYEGMEDDLSIDGYPTTIFVDSAGKVMTAAIIGVPADISDYEKTIDSLLGGGGNEFEPVQTAGAADACKVVVSDEDGIPVAGVKVQFCSDTACMAKNTDAEGTASFSAGNEKYTVHVLKVPEGFAACTEEFAVPQDLGDVRITLKKA